MEKIYGAENRCDGIKQIGRRRWKVFFGFGEDDMGTYVHCHVFDYRPSLEEVKEMILGQINAIVQERILSGLKYRDKIVWLSAENQRNIALDYAMAKGSDIQTLPTLKLGTDEDYEMYTFQDVNEFVSFAVQVQTHIEGCIAWGREQKELVNWTNYEE